MRSLLFLFLVTVLSSTTVQAQSGIDFFHGTWEEALAEAKKQEKIIFVDAYTTWCGPCKRMAKNIFPLTEVGETYNALCINIKLNMETPEGLEFQKKYPVSAYPTFYFIDEKGEAIMNVKGGRGKDDFIGLARQASGKVDRSVDYVEAYEKGDRDPELVYQYVKALNKAGKPSLKIANEYIRAQDDLTTARNLRFIHEAVTQADSRIFDLMIEHRKEIEKIIDKELVDDKIEKACRATLATAIEYTSEDLLEETKQKMKTHHSNLGNAFAYEADMKFYRALNQPKKYLDACEGCAKKEIKKDAARLHDLAATMLADFPKDKKVISSAEGFAKKAVKKDANFKYYTTYAKILYRNGKKKEALVAANKSLEMAREKSREEYDAKRLIEIIKNS
ncbi:MAG: thioredoxin family protein [Saprospiraceae bacterium]